MSSRVFICGVKWNLIDFGFVDDVVPMWENGRSVIPVGELLFTAIWVIWERELVPTAAASSKPWAISPLHAGSGPCGIKLTSCSAKTLHSSSNAPPQNAGTITYYVRFLHASHYCDVAFQLAVVSRDCGTKASYQCLSQRYKAHKCLNFPRPA